MPRDNTEEVEEKLPVQFRIGAKLLAKVDRAVDYSGQSRNAWITDAVQGLIERGSPLPLRITAEELLANKHTLMVRLDPFLVELIDETCSEREMPRTVWLLDACMSKLRRQRKN